MKASEMNLWDLIVSVVMFVWENPIGSIIVIASFIAVAVIWKKSQDKSSKGVVTVIQWIFTWIHLLIYVGSLILLFLFAIFVLPGLLAKGWEMIVERVEKTGDNIIIPFKGDAGTMVIPDLNIPDLPSLTEEDFPAAVDPDNLPENCSIQNGVLFCVDGDDPNQGGGMPMSPGENHAAPAVESPSPGNSGCNPYKVVAGDSLYAIAQNCLGNGGRWQEIATANNIVSGLITPGMELVMP